MFTFIFRAIVKIANKYRPANPSPWVAEIVSCYLKSREIDWKIMRLRNFKVCSLIWPGLTLTTLENNQIRYSILGQYAFIFC
jgi:hypothetical protein